MMSIRKTPTNGGGRNGDTTYSSLSHGYGYGSVTRWGVNA